MYLSRTSALACCLAALTCLASALPPPSPSSDHETLTRDFTSAVAALDFATATAIYDVIRESGHLDSTALQLATSMKQATLTAEFDNLNLETKHVFEALKKKLPISAGNVVFADTVCLLNLDYNEYLFSPNNDFLYDTKKRFTFLWRDGGVVAGSNWTLVPTLTPTDFKIVNVFGEYLFADDSHYYLNRRQIFTYIPSEWTGVSSNVWRIKTVGDDVILQNTWYAGGNAETEYLYAGVNLYNYDSHRRRPFGWDEKWGNDAAHIWRVAAC